MGVSSMDATPTNDYGTIEPEVETRSDDLDSTLGLELGTTGLSKTGGIIDEEFLTELKGVRGHKILREMRDNEPVIGGVMLAIEMSLRSTDKEVRPSDETDPQSLAVARFIGSCLDDLSSSWADTLSEILSMLSHGYSVHEIVYKRREGADPDSPGRSSTYDDGLIGWRKFPIRAQSTIDRWVYDEEGGIDGAVQSDPNGGGVIELPIRKMLLFRTTSHKGSPEGRSILRNAYRPWFYKKRIEEYEAIGIERELAGMPVIGAPASMFEKDAPESSKQMLRQLLRTAQRVRRDQQDGMVFPIAYDENGNLLYTFTLTSSGGKRSIDTDKVINRKTMEMAVSVLADFVLLGHESVGSFALSRDKTNLFATALDATLDSIADVFNRHAIPRLLMLNGIPLKYAPKLTFTEVRGPTLEEIAESIERFSKAGMPMFPDTGVEALIRERLGLPPAPVEGEDASVSVAEAADSVATPDASPTTEDEYLKALGLIRDEDVIRPRMDEDEEREAAREAEASPDGEIAR
jgi:hypothetical protein